ncbi:predicted protein [Aspergillus nidulans FGSC A4]|uniref:Conserved serine-rich protein (AFU_orthologue AFUA_3G10410) n=1 Tax=Emericella nidulans (strain FGSC A4 / ATCC 38163 / CBS 112.46 / NRRL 194 / M139) TaxID=227321 RepID=Q5B3D4_EMENI|nr:hypothetical protein [Aspergillus nidulans FGSC A4]EAA61024.1 predicted protein [Aspergillus nidulans FGSC A4]CBF76419.1 TPA: conserved serine-rich protein (AFU_orthologue; AFUA_3G10410) [Aspergillus nidulans FGSC A4]|eukprot:XP_662550.1 predicted protein [Aspergillus nidulans FGSC A4]
MTSLLRYSRSIRAVNPRTSRFPVFLQQRFYGQSTYGDGETNPGEDRNAPTRDMEHPGAPPPNVSKENSTKSQPSYKQDESRSGVLEEDIPKKQSDKARPVINDGRQTSNVKEDGNTKSDVPEDVKKHNEEIDQRHDKPYNRIDDGGKVGKGFWGKLDGAEGY